MPYVPQSVAPQATGVPYVPHSVDAQVEQELLESGALDGIISLSPTGEPDLDPELGSALDRKEWVHICGDISDLAGANRVPDPLIPTLTIALALALAIAIAIVLALTLALTLAFTLLPNPSPSLAGAKRVGGRTVWLNLQALSFALRKYHHHGSGSTYDLPHSPWLYLPWHTCLCTCTCACTC